MDKQQKIALILLPILAIAILAGGMFMFNKDQGVSANAYTDGVYEGTADGFGGPLKVKVVVEGGKITDVEVTEHSETDGISDPAFNEIPGAIIDAQSADVDVASGATVSSNAIMAAVKNALGAAGPQSFTDGEYEGTADGFGGPLKVKVIVEGGKITNIEILEHGETDGISDAAFDQVPGDIMDAQSTDVDTASGATVSSNAIMAAVKNALGGEDAVEEEEEAKEPIEAQTFVDGIYEGEAKGFGGTLKVKVVVEDTKLKDIEILEHGETDGISKPAFDQVPEDMIEFQSTDVDTASGATVSSEAIIKAVKNALDSEAKGEEVAEEEKEEPKVEESKKEEPKKEEPKKEEPKKEEPKVEEFTGAGKGFGGDIKVKVVRTDGKITAVEVLSHDETPGISDDAFKKTPAAIVAANSADVDTVSGATATSKGIMAAVKDALK